MLETSQLFQVHQPMLAAHQHHLDCMFQIVEFPMTVYPISMQQIDLNANAIN